jgi:hypothetical protein
MIQKHHHTGNWTKTKRKFSGALLQQGIQAQSFWSNRGTLCVYNECIDIGTFLQVWFWAFLGQSEKKSSVLAAPFRQRCQSTGWSAPYQSSHHLAPFIALVLKKWDIHGHVMRGAERDTFVYFCLEIADHSSITRHQRDLYRMYQVSCRTVGRLGIGFLPVICSRCERQSTKWAVQFCPYSHWHNSNKAHPEMDSWCAPSFSYVLT